MFQLFLFQWQQKDKQNRLNSGKWHSMKYTLKIWRSWKRQAPQRAAKCPFYHFVKIFRSLRADKLASRIKCFHVATLLQMVVRGENALLGNSLEKLEENICVCIYLRVYSFTSKVMGNGFPFYVEVIRQILYDKIMRTR